MAAALAKDIGFRLLYHVLKITQKRLPDTTGAGVAKPGQRRRA